MEQYAQNIVCNWTTMTKNGWNEHVSVNSEAITKYVIDLQQQTKTICHWDFPHVHPCNDKVFARFALVTSAVNFCYALLENPQQKFMIRVEENIFEGAMAMFHCFFRCFGQIPITTDMLSPHFAKIADTKKFFHGENVIPLLEQRHWIMKEVTEILEQNFDGDPLHIYEESHWDAIHLVDTLVRYFPLAFGADISHLYFPNDTTLSFPFNKKAKLVALLYQGRALKIGSELKPLRNIHEIIAIEDYHIPQFLHHLGILQYSQELQEKIKNQGIIFPHHPMEVEIRAATTFANNQILQKLNDATSPEDTNYWNIIHLDYQQWFGGQKVDFPHHLTPTTTY